MSRAHATNEPATTQITVRVSNEVLGRLDALIGWQGKKLGRPSSRAEVVREALMSGLRVEGAER